MAKTNKQRDENKNKTNEQIDGTKKKLLTSISFSSLPG